MKHFSTKQKTFGKEAKAIVKAQMPSAVKAIKSGRNGNGLMIRFKDASGKQLGFWSVVDGFGVVGLYNA